MCMGLETACMYNVALTLYVSCNPVGLVWQELYRSAQVQCSSGGAAALAAAAATHAATATAATEAGTAGADAAAAPGKTWQQ